MQTIPPDWQDKISLHIVAMTRAGAGDSDNSQELWDASENLLDHIHAVYGSLEQFAEFLKLDARKHATAVGISTQEVDRRLSWTKMSPRSTYVERAETIIHFYLVHYVDTIQDIDYMRDFRRPITFEAADFH